MFISCVYIGNQTRNDRTYESQINFQPKRDPGWRRHLLSSRLARKRVSFSSLSKYFANSRRISDLESQGLYANPVQFYDFLQNRVMIVFKPRYEDQDEFHLVFSKKQNYDIVRWPAMVFSSN